MSDLNNNGSFDNEKEPIESIEKTVEDLKKKIQELSIENEKVEESVSKSEKFAELKEATVEKMSESIKDIKQKATEVASNADLQNTIHFIKENAVKAVTNAKTKIETLCNDPKFIENTNRGKEVLSNVGDSLQEKASDVYQKAEKIVSEGTKSVVASVNDFYNRSEVQETIGKVKNTVTDLADKGSNAVKDILDSKNKPKK